ncbi:hypothetical protein ES703_79771 [subsurface metagenome]
MARPRIIYENLWKKGIALTPSPAADSQHPLSDTQLNTLNMYFKASTAATPCTMPMDLKAGTRSINFIAILGHNIESGATITFEEADNSGFNSPTETPAFQWSAKNIFEFLATPLTEQYVRLKLVKAGGFAAPPQVATILCGSYFELNRSEREGYGLGPEDPSVVEEGDSGVAFVCEKPRMNVGNFPFVGISDAVKVQILSFLDKVGISDAFVLCFNYADPNNESIWVRNSEAVIPRWGGQANNWIWELRVREVK